MKSRNIQFSITVALTVSVITAVLASGLKRVPQGHRGVVIQFGAVHPAPLGPGLHFVAPWPVARVSMVPVEQIRQVQVHQPQANGGGPQPGEYLTGDENLLQVSMQIDYRVTDPLEIARTGLASSNLKLARLAEAELVASLAKSPVAEILGPGREKVGQDLRQAIQAAADRQALGVEVVALIWLELIPPKEVQAAFEAAQTAVNEAAQSVAEAKTVAERDWIKTGSDAVRIMAEADTAATATKAAAVTEAVRFKALLQQARRTGFMPTAKQLWLDTVAELLPNLRGRTLLTTDQPVDLTIIRSLQNATKP